MSSNFELKPMTYSLRDGSKLILAKTKSSRFYINSLPLRGSLLWNNLPMCVKSCQSLNELTLELKNWEIFIDLHSVSLKHIFNFFLHWIQDRVSASSCLMC